MLKKLFITSFIGLLLSTGIKPTMAGTVVENIAKSGTLTVGTSFDVVPYAYINAEEKLDGFSIDVIKLIQQQLEKELGRTIQLDFVEVNSLQQAIPKMMSGEIDIACNTIFTWERDKYVDFTLRYTLSGIRLLVPKGKITDTQTSFAGKKIGIPPQTFVKDAVKLAHPNAVFVEIASIQDGVTALKDGKIDALAGDTVILDGVRQQIDPDGFEQFPSLTEKPYAQYGVACIVPENNSAFLNIANYSIAKMMEGYLVNDAEMTKLVNKWNGPEGVVNIFTDEAIKQFFQNNITNHEQISFPQK